MDKIAVYKTKRRNGAVATCKTFLTFNYKTTASTTVTFQYKECGGIINTVTYPLPISIDFSTYVISEYLEPVCFEEGTLVRISGLSNINTFTYGTCPE